MGEQVKQAKSLGSLETLVFLLAFIGAGGFVAYKIAHVKKPVPVVAIQSASAPPAVEYGPVDPKIQNLANYAKAHGIRWRIYCTSSATEESYTGWAIQPGDVFEIYAEDGGKWSWLTYSHGTQKGVAVELLGLIKGPPNSRPEKRPPADKGGSPARPVGNTDTSEQHEKPLKCMKEITSENVGQKCDACDAMNTQP
jgi:hypothetical protein